MTVWTAVLAETYTLGIQVLISSFVYCDTMDGMRQHLSVIASDEKDRVLGVRNCPA